jgi:hypothetical protein
MDEIRLKRSHRIPYSSPMPEDTQVKGEIVF